MKEIQLTRGQVAIVDEIDFSRLKNYKWQASWSPEARSFYAKRVLMPSRSSRLMHRDILNAAAGQVIDHINHDTLDNRRKNLRFVTNSQNQMNRRGCQINSSTGIRGVALTSAGV